MSNSNIPETLAQDVVTQIGIQAEAQGTTVNELLRKAFATQVGSIASKSAIENDSESSE
ncbi:MAG TPA: hypothetical protein VFI84_03480 [Candidatus Saccharimonadales bacterium]|nr:hypothetical protein [Candidatus Saccharimonadales bacterium]